MSTPDPSTLDIRDDRENNRYVAEVGEGVAEAEYILTKDGEIVFTHTEVPRGHEGEGIGSALVRFALDDARERGLNVRAICPFVQSFIGRHPEYRDLLA